MKIWYIYNILTIEQSTLLLALLIFPRLRKDTKGGNLKPTLDLVANPTKLERALSKTISQSMEVVGEYLDFKLGI